MQKNEQENAADAAYDPTRADQPKICANCRKEIDTKEWHPVTTRTDANGTFSVHAFCDEDCRAEWVNTDTTNTIGGA